MSELSTDVAIVGGGPAGLMAAETLARAGFAVGVYESKPSLGRKFLRAGVGGLNITHNEDFQAFCSRYGEHQPLLQPMLDRFSPASVRAWVKGLGIDTFDGSSGKVFPVGMKAAPLLRAWVKRLQGLGVQFHLRHRWEGWAQDGALRFTTPGEAVRVTARATILALGGGSWPKLGSDAAWVPWLEAKGVVVEPMQSANCGFNVGWSPYLRAKFAGTQIKSVAISFTDASGHTDRRRGEFVLTENGVEGSLVYAFSRQLRQAIQVNKSATFYVDLAPDRSLEHLTTELSRPRGARSMSSHLQSRVGVGGVKAALLHEVLGKAGFADPLQLAHAIKALPITVVSTRPLPEAISTAGGVALDEIDVNAMLRKLPGVFVAGEMLDWEAPTGGYLLTACLAQGVRAGEGVAAWLSGQSVN